jgi:LPS export ABC transporter protein LptC
MKSRILIFVLVLGFIAIAVGWVYESRLGSRVKVEELEIPDNIDYFLTDLNYRAVNESGQLDYEFSSPRLEHRPLNDVSLIEVPALNIYRSANHWQVNAQQGELQHRDNLLWLRQQVVMQKNGTDPFELLTESIRFEPDKNLVSSETDVLMRSKQARIEAKAAVFDLAAGIYRLRKTRAVYYRGDS